MIASSDEWAVLLEELQYSVGEGPAAEAFASGGPVLAGHLSAEEHRWPGFIDGAFAAGAHAVFAFPLQIGAIRLGVLSLYRRSPDPLSDEELSSALTLADLATTALLTDSSGSAGQLADWAREDAAGHYDDVNMATGMIAATLRIGLDEALLRLRAHAFSHRIPITDVAKAVLDRTLRFGPSPE